MLLDRCIVKKEFISNSSGQGSKSMSEKIMDGIMEEAAMDEETMDAVIMNERAMNKAYPDQGGGRGEDSGSGPGTGTALLEKEQVEERTRKDDTGDNDRYAHYVSKERLEQARLTGRPVIALCGKVWIPKRNPEDYPVCPECKRVYAQMGSGQGGF